jgi:type III secretion protein N (ATPase)
MGTPFSVMRPPPNPFTRPRIKKALPLGVRAIDALLTVGEGQRIGLFAGSGVGKSTLLGQIARQASADVFVVCLIGERGREVVEFLEDALGEEGRKRGVVICATSDVPALIRLQSAYVATAIAEHFRDQGKRVLLLMDSVTRFARAGREVGLAAGEPPARRGYPPSVLAALPGLLERSGTSPEGSITALYTVLVEGGDMEEPIADEVRGILDGHIVLDRNLAVRGRYPAIDVLKSLSRVMPAVTSEAQRDQANTLRGHLAAFEEKRDLVSLGAYKAGSDPALDAAIARMPAIEAFLRQRPEARADVTETWQALGEALRGR